MAASDAREGMMTRHRAEIWEQLHFLFQGYNDMQVRAAVYFKGRLDIERLDRAVRYTMEQLPLLKSRYVEDPSKPYWEETGLPYPDMVTVVQSNCTDEEAANFLTGRINRDEGPQLKLEVVRGLSNDTLCLVMSRMVCDEGGLKEYLYYLGSVYSALRYPGSRLPEPTVRERGMRQVIRRLRPMERVRVHLSGYASEKRESLTRIPFSGRAGIPFLVTQALPVGALGRLRSYAREHDVTIYEVVLAAYYRAVYMMFPGRRILPFSITCLADLRGYLPWGEDRAICGLSAPVLSHIGRNIGKNLDETVEKVRVDTAKKRSLASVVRTQAGLEWLFRFHPYPKIKDRLNRKFVRPVYTYNYIGAINSARLDFDELPVLDACVTGSLRRAPYFQLNVTIFEESVTLSAAMFGNREDQAMVRYFLALICRELPQ